MSSTIYARNVFKGVHRYNLSLDVVAMDVTEDGGAMDVTEDGGALPLGPSLICRHRFSPN